MMADNNIMSLEISETEITAVKEALCAQQQLLQKLYNELDVERESAATAASEALSMILRLQGEMAVVKMESNQYKRMAEEKMCHAEESLAIFEDVMYQREMEIASLDFQVQAYRYKLLSLGVSEMGVGEVKFPENLLQRNENLSGEMGLQSTMRRNSMPAIPLKSSNHKKGISERERSASPDLIPEENTNQELSIQSSDMEKKNESCAVGDINSYWEQIRKLDERVREITDQKGVKSVKSGVRTLSVIPPVSTGMKNKSVEIKHSENLWGSKETKDSGCSSNVHDVFEVPQTREKGCETSIKEQKKLDLEGDERLGKPDCAPDEALRSNTKDETEWIKNLRRSNDGISVECHFARVRPTIAVHELHAKFHQPTRTSEITEVERQNVREEANRGEEEMKMLKEIKEQLNSIQSEIISWKSEKSSPAHELSLNPLAEAMMHFWL